MQYLHHIGYFRVENLFFQPGLKNGPKNGPKNLKIFSTIMGVGDGGHPDDGNFHHFLLFKMNPSLIIKDKRKLFPA